VRAQRGEAGSAAAVAITSRGPGRAQGISQQAVRLSVASPLSEPLGMWKARSTSRGSKTGSQVVTETLWVALNHVINPKEVLAHWFRLKSWRPRICCTRGRVNSQHCGSHCSHRETWGTTRGRCALACEAVQAERGNGSGNRRSPVE